MKCRILGLLAVFWMQIGFAGPSAIKLSQNQFFRQIQQKLGLDHSWRLKATLKVDTTEPTSRRFMSVTGYFKRGQLIVWALEGPAIWELRIDDSMSVGVFRRRQADSKTWTKLALLDGSLETFIVAVLGKLVRDKKPEEILSGSFHFTKAIRLPKQSFVISPKNAMYNFKKIEFAFDEKKGWQRFLSSSHEPMTSVSLDIYDLSRIKDSEFEWSSPQLPDELFN